MMAINRFNMVKVATRMKGMKKGPGIGKLLHHGANDAHGPVLQRHDLEQRIDEGPMVPNHSGWAPANRLVAMTANTYRGSAIPEPAGLLPSGSGHWWSPL
jgi:hypothetical protein